MFLELARFETLRGRIVLTIHWFPHADKEELTAEQKELVDALHLRKIDMADKVLVICPGGYIGTSTKGEVDYAMRRNKEIEFIQDPVLYEAFEQRLVGPKGCHGGDDGNKGV